MIRLYMAEDDRGLVSILREVFSEQPDFVLVGHSDSVVGALTSADWPRIDVLLVDLSLRDSSGIDLIAVVASRHPHVRILVHTVHDGRDHLFIALRAGACGYVLKGTPPEELCQALRDAMQGHSTVSPAVARFLIEHLQAPGPVAPRPVMPPPRVPRPEVAQPGASADLMLSPRELAVLSEVAAGFRNKEVADRLAISPHTVHAHLKKIYEKLHVANRSEAIRRAERLGHLRPPSPS